MKALTLRQPWAYSVTHLGKRIVEVEAKDQEAAMEYVVTGSLRRLGLHDPDSPESPPAEEWRAVHRELEKPVRLVAESPRAAAKAWADENVALQPGTIFVAYVIGKGSYEYQMIVKSGEPA
jgi:hypothetical protein